MMSTTGSLRHGGWAVIYIPKKDSKEMEKELRSDHSFFIAHECAHILYDDHCSGIIEQERFSAFFRLITYVVMAVAASQIFTSWIPIHLTGCISAKIFRIFVNHLMDWKIEERADLFAASRAKEIAFGGIAGFTVHLKNNRTYRNQPMEKWTNLSEGLQAIQEFILRKIKYSSMGDYRFDYMHPPLSKRIDYLFNYVVSRFY